MKAVAVLLALLLWVVTASPFLQAGDSTLSLHLKNEPPRTAFEKFFHAMSLNVRAVDPKLWEQVASKPVTIDIDNGGFWDVMTLLDRATGICMSEVQGDEALLVLDHGASSHRPSALIGPLRVSVLAAQSQYEVQFVKTIQAKESCDVRLQIEADPRYHAVTLESTSGGNGAKRSQKLIEFRSGRAIVTTTADVGTPGQSSVDVRTAYLLSHAASIEPIEIQIADGRGSATKDLGDVHCSISVHPVGGGYGADIELKGSGLDAQQRQRVAAALNNAASSLVDAAGNRYLFNGGNAACTDELITGSIEFTAVGMAKPPGAPRKLVWHVPAKIESELVTLELKDVPLP